MENNTDVNPKINLDTELIMNGINKSMSSLIKSLEKCEDINELYESLDNINSHNINNQSNIDTINNEEIEKSAEHIFDLIQQMGFGNNCIDLKDNESKMLFMKICLGKATKEEELKLYSKLLITDDFINKKDDNDDNDDNDDKNLSNEFSISDFVSKCFKSGHKYAKSFNIQK